MTRSINHSIAAASLVSAVAIAGVVVALTPHAAPAQTTVGVCMSDLLRRGISERNAAIACSGQRHVTAEPDCVRQQMYRTFTARTQFSNGNYDYGGDFDFLAITLPSDYLTASGCTSRVCPVGPQVTVQVKSESEAINQCLNQYPINYTSPYEYGQ